MFFHCRSNDEDCGVVRSTERKHQSSAGPGACSGRAADRSQRGERGPQKAASQIERSIGAKGRLGHISAVFF